MICNIIKPAGAPENGGGGESSWNYQQDPDSGAIVRRWVDIEETPDVNERRSGLIVPDVPLAARGIIDGGIRVAGTTERFSETYENVDWVKATFGPGVSITKRDQVTNIRNKRTKELIWKEEEISGFPPTMFNVMGIIPVLDMYSNLVEQAVLLQRAEVQS